MPNQNFEFQVKSTNVFFYAFTKFSCTFLLILHRSDGKMKSPTDAEVYSSSRVLRRCSLGL